MLLMCLDSPFMSKLKVLSPFSLSSSQADIWYQLIGDTIIFALNWLYAFEYDQVLLKQRYKKYKTRMKYLHVRMTYLKYKACHALLSLKDAMDSET